MTKLDTYKDKAQSWSEIQLKSARQNALDKGEFEFADMYESVLDQRFPSWDEKTITLGGKKPHIAKLKSEEMRFESGITAFVWMVNRLFKLHPEVLSSNIFESFITNGEHGAVYLAKHPKDLFKNYETSTMNYEQLVNGLYLKKTLSTKQMLDLLAKLCAVAKLGFGDWDFHEVGKSQPSLEDIHPF